MPINIEKKILFIHIPKCSGTYITRLFGMEGNNFLHNGPQSHITWGDCHVLGRTLQHYPLDMIINVINTFNIMNNMRINVNIHDYYVFAVTRNPYTRFISAYNQYPNKCNQKFADMINNKNITEFAVYLKNRVKNEGYHFLKYGAFHQFEPMIFYLQDHKKHNINIDFIKMEENYSQQIKELCVKYNFNYNDNILNKNINNTDYSSYYKNKILIDCINFIYEEDFKFFNYKQF